MATQSFHIKYEKNEGLILSPSELLERYFHGISTCTKDGREISQETLVREILTAQEKMEEYLSVKMSRQVVSERRDFDRMSYYNWGFTRVTFPIVAPLALLGFISTTKQTEFPLEWLSHSVSTEEDLLGRNLHIVPAGGATPLTQSVVFVGITPNAGFLGVQSIPDYWDVKYVTGFGKMPETIRDVVGKLASMAIFAVLGDILLGAGIASQSLSLDGFSQSIATTQSAENSAFSARIRQYAKELKRELPDLKDHYLGIRFLAM